jgi:hypothetical protein
MHEIGIAHAVGRGDHDVRFGDGDRVYHLRQQHGHAGAQQDAELAASDEPAGLGVLQIFVKMILIAHVWLLGDAARRTVEKAPHFISF